MQKWTFANIILVLLTITKVYAQSDSYDSHVRQYISQYKDWAIEEQRRTGVPAAITLAQGIHETSAGSSELALNANNHFGIKCKKDWKGDTYAYTDDAPNECFRKYKSAFNSYKDHSDYLRSGKRYEALFALKLTDYKGWATGLKRYGYATNPKYSQILIRLVEDYDLQQYTYQAMKEEKDIVKTESAQQDHSAGEVIPHEDAPVNNTYRSNYEANKKSSLKVGYTNTDQLPQKEIEKDVPKIDNTSKPDFGKTITVNGLKAFYAQKGAMLLDAAVNNNIRYAKLLEMNDLPDAPLEADMFIYLEKKNTKGNSETHLVKHGETLLQIAQQEGMQLKWLKFYNRIGGNEEISEGATVQLQQLAEKKPATHPKIVMNEPMHDEPFAGANPRVIPQGATRMRSGYIRKADIEKYNDEPLKNAATQEDEKTEITHEATADNDQPSAETHSEGIAKTNVAAKTKIDTAQKNVTFQKLVLENNTPQKEIPANTIEKKTVVVTQKVDMINTVQTPQNVKSEIVKEENNSNKVVETLSVKENVISAPTIEIKKDTITSAQPTINIEKEKIAVTSTTEKEDKKLSDTITILKREETTIQQPATEIVKEEKKAELKAEPAKENIKEEIVERKAPIISSAKDTLQDPTVAEETTATNNIIKANDNKSTTEKEIVKENVTTVKVGKDTGVSTQETTEKADKEAIKDTVVVEQKEAQKADADNDDETIAIEKKNESNATTQKVENYTTIPVAPLAGSKAKKEVVSEEQTEEEPKNKFDRLKAKLDKVVYASDNVVENEKSNQQQAKEEEKSNKIKEEQANKAKYYTVKKGDTFASVIKENKITKQQLMTWNKLKNQSLKIGQKIKVKP